MSRHRDKIMEMAAVMMKAVDLDEKDSSREHELLIQLRTENEGLRQLLAITRQNGNLAHDPSRRSAPAPADPSDEDVAAAECRSQWRQLLQQAAPAVPLRREKSLTNRRHREEAAAADKQQ